jgi:hypothetical protein
MPFRRDLSIAVLRLVCAPTALGCSLAGCLNNGEEVRPTFTILVTHDDKPLAGVSFHVIAKGAEQFSGVTDENGTIHVPKLPPGLYWLNGDLLGTGVVYTCFHVGEKPLRRAKSRLIYTWGDEAPATSKISGRLVASQPAKGGHTNLERDAQSRRADNRSGRHTSGPRLSCRLRDGVSRGRTLFFRRSPERNVRAPH